jgi:hypothetical protein
LKDKPKRFYMMGELTEAVGRDELIVIKSCQSSAQDADDALVWIGPLGERVQA